MNLSEKNARQYMQLLISRCYKHAKDNNIDIIHSHFNLFHNFYSNLVDIPTVQSIHSPVASDIKPLLLEFKNNKFISFSLAQRKTMPELNWIANIYHGVDMKTFTFNEETEDYFLYLGRITEVKGVHLAIEAAKKANVPLIIAGSSYENEGYWHKKIEKNIDGKMIRYVGLLDFHEKIKYFQKAKGLLFPSQWEEPFGISMIEAMSCGTPVIGWDRGSVPEVISHGNTGYVVNSVEEMVQAIKNIDKIDRKTTRKRAERYFSVEKMVSGYTKVYSRVIEEYKFKKNKNNGK